MAEISSPDAHEVRDFRTEHELTRPELAERLGASVRTIEDWEAGRRQPPPLLRLALSAVARRLTPWSPRTTLGPKAAFEDVASHVDRILADRADNHLDQLKDRFENALGLDATPAETLLCVAMMDTQDGYNPVDILEDWSARPQSGWRTSMAFRPDGFDLRPAIVAELRYNDAVRSLVVFVDAHRPGERLPAKVKIETALIARGFRVLSFSEADIFSNGATCAETVTTVIEELAEEVLFAAGHVTSAWKRADRRSELPDG